MTRSVYLMLLLAAVILAPAGAHSADEVVGVLRLYPAADQAAVAVEVDLGPGMALHGFSWFNNDGRAPFPHVVVLEAAGDGPPDLSGTGLVLDEISGPSLSWGQATLAPLVTSSTGRIHVVFLYPSGREMQSLGEGGGPGIGLRTETQPARAFATANGSDWVALRWDDRGVALDPQLGLAKAAMVLSALATSLGQDKETPQHHWATSLHQPWPNPFNPTTEIAFEVATRARVVLEVYDVRGRRVKTLVDQYKSAGAHRVIWHGIDENEQPVASGIYYVRMTAQGQHFSRKLVLLR